MKYKYNGQWYDVSIKALDGMPIGSIILFAGETIPTGWLICDGDTLNEEEYPELFDIIRYKYGGSGLDFNLPNFKDRVPVGLDANDTDFNTLGKTGGEKTHTLTINEMPSHNHSVDYAVNSASGGAQFGYSYSPVGVYGTNNTGGGQAHNNLQPYLVVNYIIKATNTTPTMASVVNATNNSTEDTYSCDYSNEHYGGVELYNDTTGTTGNVSLNETTANFKYIEIYAVDNDSRTSHFNIFKFNASSNTFNLYGSSVNANGYAIFTSLYTNNGTTLTNGGHYLYNGSFSSYPIFRIVKVVGYK